MRKTYQALTLWRTIQDTLNFEKVEEERQSWHTLLIFAQVLIDFNVIPTYQIQLRRQIQQVIKNVNLEIGEREMETY